MFVKTPSIIKHTFSNYVWSIPSHEKEIFLTFDDGPTPRITEQVLDILNQFNAKATFFCIGKNIVTNPKIFERIQIDGHGIGNHTNDHIKGWKTSTDDYIDSVLKTEKILASEIKTQNSKLFRPPYGQIKPSQSRILRKLGYKIIMWDVLSYDWETSYKEEKILKNVLDNTVSGSIVVFHDSHKASKNILYALPKFLDFFSKKGYHFKKIT